MVCAFTPVKFSRSFIEYCAIVFNLPLFRDVSGN
jgi:hypothetical protein